MSRTERIRDFAVQVVREGVIDPWKDPFAFAEEVGLRACKAHVQAALEAAADAAKLINVRDPYCEYPKYIIDKEGIKNSYPLDKIK